MPDKTPPLYKWHVSHSGGTHFFTVEAAYSAVEPTGHMVLKNSDGNPVFTAEPGLGCTFQRLARVEPAETRKTVIDHLARAAAEQAAGSAEEAREWAAANPPLFGDSFTAPLTFTAFGEAWEKACAEAWDDGRREPSAICLPDFLWPHVAEARNPVTGRCVAVRRVPAFPVGGDGDCR